MKLFTKLLSTILILISSCLAIRTSNKSINFENMRNYLIKSPDEFGSNKIYYRFAQKSLKDKIEAKNLSEVKSKSSKIKKVNLTSIKSNKSEDISIYTTENLKSYKYKDLKLMVPKEYYNNLVPLCSIISKTKNNKPSKCEPQNDPDDDETFPCPDNELLVCRKCVNPESSDGVCPDGCYTETTDENNFCSKAVSGSPAVESFLIKNKKYYKFWYSFLHDEDKKKPNEKFLPEIMRRARVTLKPSPSMVTITTPEYPEEVQEGSDSVSSTLSNGEIEGKVKQNKSKDKEDNESQSDSPCNNIYGPKKESIFPNSLDPSKSDVLVIIDTSTSLTEIYKNSKFSKLEVIQDTLNKLSKGNKKINFCKSIPPGNKFDIKVELKQKSPAPTIIPFSSYIGIKSCLKAAAALEKDQKANFSKIFIIGDKICGDDLTKKDKIEGLKKDLSFIIHLFNGNSNDALVIKNWMDMIEGKLEEIKIGDSVVPLAKVEKEQLKIEEKKKKEEKIKKDLEKVNNDSFEKEKHAIEGKKKECEEKKAKEDKSATH